MATSATKSMKADGVVMNPMTARVSSEEHDTDRIVDLLNHEDIPAPVVWKLDWEVVKTWNPTIIKMSIFIAYYFVGIVFYSTREGWNILDCIYYITVTVTTVGYGYFHPTTRPSESSFAFTISNEPFADKIFTIFYILFGIPVVLTIVNEFVKVLLISCQEFMITTYFGMVYKRTRVNYREMQLHKMYLSFIVVIFSVIIGTLYYSGKVLSIYLKLIKCQVFLGNENWELVESIYWSVATVTSVGYGLLSCT